MGAGFSRPETHPFGQAASDSYKTTNTQQPYALGMTKPVKPIPNGASVVIPRLVCRDPAAELEFCRQVFQAKVHVTRPGADGTIAHAMITIGPAMVMIESEWPGIVNNRAPKADGSSPVVLFVYVEDADSTVERALAAGATLLMPLADQFWGDRTAWIMDPSGHVWTVATRIEETTEEQRQARLAALQAGRERPNRSRTAAARQVDSLGCSQEPTARGTVCTR